MRSATFQAFYRSFSDNSSAGVRNGLDLGALGSLQGDERDEAEKILLRRAKRGDDRGMIGLGVLRTKEAEPILEPVFEAEKHKAGSSHGRRLANVAHALYRIRPDDRWLRAEIAVLERSPRPTTQSAAARALADFPHPDAAEALTRALDAQDGLVRHHAACSLLKLHGVGYTTGDHGHPVYLVMRDGPEREAAKQALLGMIAGKPLVEPP